MIDTLEFIDPIFLNSEEEQIDRLFYVAGVRHYLGCSTDDLHLEPEPSNEYDSRVVKI